MFIFTARVTKEKLVIALLALAAVIVALVLLFGGSSETTTETIAPANVSTNDGRLEFISSYGWEVNTTPLETTEVKVPEDNSEVFDRYNELQKSQGYDLSKFAGKKLKKVTYEVLNHPSGETGVKLTLFINKKEVVGGDVSSGRQGGFMHSLEMPRSDSGVSLAGSTRESSEPN